MGSLSPARRVAHQDLLPIRHAYEHHLAKGRRNGKQWVKHTDLDASIRFCYSVDTAYIVDEAYLVIYDIDAPWWNPNVLVLSELTVARIYPGSDFKVVPAFLEAKGREAGCKLVCVGTALTRSDKALASLYQHEGFRLEAFNLAKEI